MPCEKALGDTSLKSQSSVISRTAAGAGADTDKNSIPNLINIVKEAKEAAVTRRNEVATKRDRVFNDLDDAENIVLSLLDCASDVANSLSEMTTAKTNGDNNSFEVWATNIRESGFGYLAGVKKLHSLLAPHSSLVKAYHDEEGGDLVTTADTTSEITVKTENRVTHDDILRKATSNMYAARVEKRLALERNIVLKEMIRLEELESSGEGAADKNATSVSKRKHELVE